MPGRHRSAGVLSRPATRTPLVIALVAVMATGIVLVVQNLADAGGCGERTGIRLSVAADPAIASAVREVADGWIESAQPDIDGDCVAVDVTPIGTAEVASTLATSAGGFVDVATQAAVAGEVPDVWVPEASYWVARLQTVSRSLFAPNPVPLATSPVVLASSPAAADLLGSGPVDPADLREPVLAALAAQEPSPVRLAEPRRDTAGLVGAGWLRQAVVTAEEELPNVVAAFRGLGDAPPDSASLLTDFDALQRSADDEASDAGDRGGLLIAPVTAQAVATHNQSAGATPITTVPVADAPELDFPFAVLGRAPQAVQTAAGMLRTVLTGSGEVFTRHGFQPVDGSTTTIGAPEQLAQTVRIWTSATRDARVLSVANVNASMAEPMGPARRLEVFQAAAQQGLALFTEDSELGHWEYAEEWVEGVPIETLTEEHQQAVLAAIGSMQLQPTNESALFETLLAGYREIKDGYDRSRSNTLIVWTDRGDNAGELTLDETLQELERIADVTRPIRVILLGLGPDADMAQLSAIASATGGGAFHLEDPDEIGLVFLRALLT